MATLGLSELLGTRVRDGSGAIAGRVREAVIDADADPTRIAYLLVRTAEGERLVSADTLKACAASGVRARSSVDEWPEPHRHGGFLYLKRDLLDQQIIDVHGRKVVRVNDVDLDCVPTNGSVTLTLAGVDVGVRGAVRRLLHGVLPPRTVRQLSDAFPTRAIPWQWVDLIETDPARRIRLKISHDRLARLHPADIADIVEDLPPAEREAVFETLDEEVAAEALEEVDRKMQVAIVESLDSDRAADIMEEMDPDAAADLLGDLPAGTSEQILKEMQPEEREEVSQLLEYGERTAAGRMTTAFVSAPVGGRVADAVDAVRGFEGGWESLAAVYLTTPGNVLTGIVPLARLLTSAPDEPLRPLADNEVISCPPDASDKQVAELFDKYNLLALPVVDEHGRLTGLITADDVIAVLRRD